MTRGPSKYMTAHAVEDRLRRLAKVLPHRREAEILVGLGQTLEAVKLLAEHGDLTEAHIEAHKRWINFAGFTP